MSKESSVSSVGSSRQRRRLAVVACLSVFEGVGLVSLRDQSFELWHPLRCHVVVQVRHRLRVHAILELKLEVREECWQSQFAHHLDKGLADADTAAA